MAFASELIRHIAKFTAEISLVYDIPAVLNSLENVVRESALETYVQDVTHLIDCFVIGRSYAYYSTADIPVSVVSDFYTLLKRKAFTSQEIILENLYVRVHTVKVEIELPF